MRPLDLTCANTLGLPCLADHGVTIRSLSEATASWRSLRGQGLRLTVLGGGSNVLLPPRLRGVVWRLAAPAPRLGRHGRVEVFGGVGLDALVHSVGEAGLWGMENLAAIPGTIGAAPVQNVGAYGQSLDEVIEALEVLDLRTGQIARWSRAQAAFAYRDSLFRRQPGAYCILSLRLRLHLKGTARLHYDGVRERLETLRVSEAALRPLHLSAAIRALRREKLPDWHQYPNVGSFFKNPVLAQAAWARLQARAPALAMDRYERTGGKLSAAQLIESAGWRGRRRGPVGMAQRHALVLVNYGGATRADVLWLAGSVQASVYARYGVRLEREPLML